MMHRQISKKIFIYLLIFFSLVTVNNYNFIKFDLPNIKSLKISGLNDLEKEDFETNLDFLKNENLFFLDKKKISNKIFSNKMVENLIIIKNYPSELDIKIKKTKILALTKKNNKDYYIGANGNFIIAKNPQEELPFIFGNVEPNDFIKLKTLIINSKFDFDQIKNFYFFKSKRWDLETKNGLIIKLPTSQIEESLEILYIIINEQRFKNIKILDLRQKSQIILNERN